MIHLSLLPLISSVLQPWFDDGNIILVTDETPTAFRVHRGVLARHSEMFQGMFDVPQPSAIGNSQTIYGCPVVRMYDLPNELAHLIKALYDGAFVCHIF